MKLGLADASAVISVTGSPRGGVISVTVRRVVFVLGLAFAVNVTFERRSHIVVILGTGISVIDVGRGMHPVVFLTVAVNVLAAVIGRTAGSLVPLPIGQPPGRGKLERVVRPGDGFRH